MRSILLVVILSGAAAHADLFDWIPFLKKGGRKTVAERIEETRPRFESELLPRLKAAGIEGLPKSVALVFLKDARSLILFAGENESSLKFIKTYDVKAASGEAGPKLKEGDRQVPEGVYRVEALNPNSSYYLSLRVNYPSPFDRKQAKLDGRTNLGGDIMIHGNWVSIGCIAIGDAAIAEVFHLAAVTDYRKWKLLLAPVDLRTQPPPPSVIRELPWMAGVYENLKSEMLNLK